MESSKLKPKEDSCYVTLNMLYIYVKRLYIYLSSSDTCPPSLFPVECLLFISVIIKGNSHIYIYIYILDKFYVKFYFYLLSFLLYYIWFSKN